MPSLPTIAHALWIFVPRKYRLSATLAGSAYQVSLAGVRGPAAAGAAPRAGVVVAGGFGMQRRRKVPGQSIPAAVLAAMMYPSIVVGGVCAHATSLTATNAASAPIAIRSDFISSLPEDKTKKGQRFLSAPSCL